MLCIRSPFWAHIGPFPSGRLAQLTSDHTCNLVWDKLPVTRPTCFVTPDPRDTCDTHDRDARCPLRSPLPPGGDILDLQDELQVARAVHDYKPCIYGQPKPVAGARLGAPG